MADTIKNEETGADVDHQLYELAYILDGNLAEERAQDTASALRSIIEKKKSIIIEATQPKVRKLAYTIGKNTAGFFGWVKFLTQASDIEDIEKQIKKMPEVIRILTVQSYREELMEQRTKFRRKVVTEEEKEKIQEIDKKLEEILGE